LVLFALAVATDLLDGYLARKLNATTKFGAYYDAATDFALVLGIYSLFAVKGFYPIWLLILIAASFAQFIATSRYAKKIYDPIGRYIGSALYIGIVLTLIFPVKPIFIFVQYAFIVFFLISLASRIVSLTKNRA
jgi:phosphatidylglycerophosphate synthase